MESGAKAALLGNFKHLFVSYKSVCAFHCGVCSQLLPGLGKTTTNNIQLYSSAVVTINNDMLTENVHYNR